VSPSRKIAENFIKDQLRIMRKFGNEPKLSSKRYEELIAETQRSFESLRPPESLKAKAKAKAASRK
jgi:hypothetical protein